MRITIIRSAILVLAAGAIAAARTPPPKPASAPAGAFRPLVQPNAKWTLLGPNGMKIVVENHDVRKIGAADTARLRYTVIVPGKKPAELDAGAPRRVAVSPTGAWLFAASDDDAKIAAALAKPPQFTDPPQLVKPSRSKNGDYVNLIHLQKGDKICVGRAPPPGTPCGDICFAELCLNPRDGLVEMGGTYTPNQESFTQAGWDR